MGTAVQYYLQVVREGEEPTWPVSKEELEIGSKSLGSGFIQYWAYPKISGKSADEDPYVELIASKNPTDHPAVLIDQSGELEDGLELILVKDGHAWAKNETSLENLEDNISATLDFAKDKLNIDIEHFMTTDRVDPKVERKLDELEEAEEEFKGGEEHVVSHDHPVSLAEAADNFQVPQRSRDSQSLKDKILSKLGIIIPIVLVVAVFSGVIVFRDTITGKLTSNQSSSEETIVETVSPTPTPSPTPSVDRSEVKVRVLNGTTKTGAAGALAKQLKELGWQTVKTGNAKNQATSQTLVRVKEGEETTGEVLASDLAPDLNAEVTVGLKESDTVDAEVVIGKE